MQLSELIQNHMFSRKDAKFWKMIYAPTFQAFFQIMVSLLTKVIFG